MNRPSTLVVVGLVAASVVLSAAVSSEAARGRGPRARGPSGTFRGVIAAVVGNTVRLHVGKDAGKSVNFWTNDKTSVTGGGKRGTVNDLAAGQTVTVKASNGHAASIEVEVKDDPSGNDKPKRGTRNPTGERAAP